MEGTLAETDDFVDKNIAGNGDFVVGARARSRDFAEGAGRKTIIC